MTHPVHPTQPTCPPEPPMKTPPNASINNHSLALFIIAAVFVFITYYKLRSLSKIEPYLHDSFRKISKPKHSR